MLLTTSHKSCTRLVNLMVKRGIKYAVVSPGSRNGALLIALSQEPSISKVVVVDERSAGFVALGISQSTQSAVLVVCTSGTALLNLAPAVAEAYYQQLPLIVVSADRPKEWIDQNDSQTLRQFGVFENFVKKSFDISSQISSESDSWYVNRVLNEAYNLAVEDAQGPVHINMHVSEPIYKMEPCDDSGLVLIDKVSATTGLRNDVVQELRQIIASKKKVMVFCGMMPENENLQSHLVKLSDLDNVVVLAEHLSNIVGGNVINRVDTIMSEKPEASKWDYAPDLLIYVGGAPVSKKMKLYLRSHASVEQWRVGVDNTIIDTMQGITKHFNITAECFFESLMPLNENVASQYKSQWMELRKSACVSHSAFALNAEWSDFKAMSVIMQMQPESYNIQLSNGMTVRYAQLFEAKKGNVYMCNRGVSGIDGSTSTALGASIADEKKVLLITGDMSFAYDINGLASKYNSPNLKIVVICNDGGGIFRTIDGLSSLPVLEEYFEVKREIEVGKLAVAFGYEYLEANDESQLREAFSKLLQNDEPTILAVKTPNAKSAEIIKNYHKRNH